MRFQFYIQSLVGIIALLFQQTCEAQQSKSNIVDSVFMNSLSETDTLQIHVSSYHCFSNAWLYVKIFKDCEGLSAAWHLNFEPLMNKNCNGLLALTSGQVAALKEFETAYTQPFQHVKYCSGTIDVDVSLGTKKKSMRYCGCAPDAYLALSQILLPSSNSSVQQHLSKTKNDEHRPNTISLTSNRTELKR